jgi:hypothetical protein
VLWSLVLLQRFLLHPCQNPHQVSNNLTSSKSCSNSGTIQ